MLLDWILAPLRWLSSWPLKLIGAPKRLMGLTFPARVAVLLALFQILLTVVALVCLNYLNRRPRLMVETSIWSLLVIVVLWFAVPLAVYQTLKLWLQGEQSRYPEIDQAWKLGMEALQRNGVDLEQVPIFLILGASDSRLPEALMGASGVRWIVEGEPDGRQPLRWYASEKGVFLCLQSVGCLGRVNEEAGRFTGGPVTSIKDTMEAAQAPMSITGTLAFPTGSPASTPAARRVTDTATFDQPPTASAGIRGTLVPGGGGSEPAGGASAARPASGKLLTAREIDLESDRLHYVGSLLRRARQPYCPVNGILTVFPLQTLKDIIAAQDASDGIRRDLTSLRDSLQLRCPVTALITDMESEAGFGELIARVGADRARETRFGKGFSLTVAPTVENMDALSAHACGAFEDWVYTLFREIGGWERPGNSRLYMLLCTIRGHLQRRIRSLLVHGFGESVEAGSEESGPMFGGCYFAATGDRDSRRAFVRSVIEKMIQQEEDVEWTEAALLEDRRYRRLAQIGLVVDTLLALALIGFVVFILMRVR